MLFSFSDRLENESQKKYTLLVKIYIRKRMPKHHQILLPCLLLFILYFISAPILFANIINVPRDVRTIQGAIDQVEMLDTVLVSPGRYNENVVFGGQLVFLTSLFMLEGDEDYIESTIIDGGGESACLVFRDAEDEDAIVSGFTITNGWQNFGGGIDCQNDTRPILENLIVTGNEAAQIGGGIYCTWSATPTIRNVIIENNIANDGAGVGLAHDCHPIISNVIIRDNASERYGGGVFAGHGEGEGTFEDVLIVNNTAAEGGGVYIEYSVNVIFNNTIIEDNEATESGDAIKNYFGQVIMNLCEISGGEIGSIELYHSEIIMDSCSITGSGGIAIEAVEALIELSNTQLIENHSGIIAGYSELVMNLCEIMDSDSLAISVFDSSVVMIDSSEITGNGGAGFVADSSIVAINVTNITDNLFGIFAAETNLTLMGCEISDSDNFGISVEDSAVVQIEETEILRNGGVGLTIDSSVVSLVGTSINDNLYGIFASDSDLGLLRCGILRNDSFGVSVKDSSVMQIESTSISSNDGGGILAESSTAALIASSITDNLFGASISNSDFNFHNCEINLNETYGLSLVNSSNVEVDSSVITDNTEAAIVSVSSSIEIIGTGIYRNETGIECISTELSLNDCDIFINDANGVSAIDSSHVEIGSSRIHINGGIGLFVQNSLLNVLQSDFIANESGIVLESSIFNIRQSQMSRNDDIGIAAFNGCFIDITSCKVEENRSEGGMSISGSTIIANQCIIRGNHAEWGGGIKLSSCNAQIHNSYFIDNVVDDYAGAIYSNNSNITLINNTILNNSSEGIAGAVYGRATSIIKFLNNVIWNNPPQAIVSGSEMDTNIFAYNDIQGGIDSVSGDGEIIWLEGNIDADPLFATIDSLGHSFMPDSPCIDAGRAFFVYQGDTLVNLTEDDYLDDAPDMGAFERDHTGIGDEDEEIPKIYSLISTYPNPFNSSLRININLKAPSLTRLAIFDLQGREVAVLNDKPLPAGKSNFIWDAELFSQGIYFVRLETADFGVYKKVVYLK